MGQEFELKFSATPAQQEAILALYRPWHTIAMETTYFDTPDGRLSAQHITLRLRSENGNTVCTLKTPLPDGSRGEWECPAADIRGGIASLLALGAPEDALSLDDAELLPVCGARFTRHARILPTADGTAELALDCGTLLGGQKECPLCEIEVEQKSGTRSAVEALATQLAATYGLTIEPKSKFRRALALAKEK